MVDSSVNSVVQTILAPHIERTSEDDRPIIVMTCGIAGSGKTTLAKAIESRYPQYHRLSIDEITFKNHGIFGVDYEPLDALYDQFQDESDNIYLSTLRTLLAERKDVILERAFYAKADRDVYRKMAEEAEARVVLVFMKAEGEQSKEVLWERICRRSKEVKTADTAYDISRETFEAYWSGFENPDGEGEIVVSVV